MAIGFRALTTAGDSNGSTLVINKPAGVVAGDIQILNLYLEHGAFALSSVSVPGGATFTPVHTTFQTGPGGGAQFSQVTFIQVAGASEPASYTISWVTAGSYWRSAILSAWTGVDTTTPQDVAATEQASASSSTSAVAPTLTTPTAGAMVVYCETDNDGRTVTQITGWTEPTNGDFGNCNIQYKLIDGATGTITGTLDTTSWNTAQLIALRPTGGAPATKAPPPRRRQNQLWIRRRAG